VTAKESSKMKRGYDILETQLLGTVAVVVSENGVEEVCLTKESFKDYLKHHPEVEQNPKLCQEAISQLDAYFKGERLNFELPLALEGTEFRKQVWEALMQIPYGETRSYGEIAKSIGNPKAVRAVGSANKANVLPLIIPCHRVIGAKGRLVGFMGARTDLQARLLAHEEKIRSQRLYKH